MKRAIISDLARVELRSLVDWLADYSPRAADRATDSLLSGIGMLQEHPLIAPEIGDELRELVVRFGQYGFIIRYTVTDDAVVIQRVFHGAQDR